MAGKMKFPKMVFLRREGEGEDEYLVMEGSLDELVGPGETEEYARYDLTETGRVKGKTDVDKIKRVRAKKKRR